MSTYTRDEVRRASLTFFQDDQLATDVYVDKYALRDSNNNFYELTPADTNMRLAKEFARIEAKYPNPLSVEEIYRNLCTVDDCLLAFESTDANHELFYKEELLKNCVVDYGAIVPQGSPQAGIGNSYQLQSLSNCFVIDSPQDSYGGILHTDQEQVQIMKRRGGVGFDISTIRPKGMLTTNAAKTTDGIGVFMERFSNTCREVAQGGRRGALMLTLNCFEASTLILTEDGWQTIKNIVDYQYKGKVWTHEGFKQIDAYQKFEEKDIYEIETENGKKIKTTADHKFMVRNLQTNEEYLKAIKDVDPENEDLIFYDVNF